VSGRIKSSLSTISGRLPGAKDYITESRIAEYTVDHKYVALLIGITGLAVTIFASYSNYQYHRRPLFS
jgi:hypothetical protein